MPARSIPTAKINRKLRALERQAALRAQSSRSISEMKVGIRPRNCMSRYRVIITDFVTGSLAPEEEVLGDVADVVAANGFREADLADYLPTAAALDGVP